MEFAKLIQVEKSNSDRSLDNQFTMQAMEQAAIAQVQASHRHKDGSEVRLEVKKDGISDMAFDAPDKPIQSLAIGCNCGDVLHARFGIGEEKKENSDYARASDGSGYQSSDGVSSSYQSDGNGSDYQR